MKVLFSKDNILLFFLNRILILRVIHAHGKNSNAIIFVNIKYITMYLEILIRFIMGYYPNASGGNT